VESRRWLHVGRYDLSSPRLRDEEPSAARYDRGRCYPLWTEESARYDNVGFENRAGGRIMAQRLGPVAPFNWTSFASRPLKNPRLNGQRCIRRPLCLWMTLPRCFSDEASAAILPAGSSPPSSRRFREGGLVTTAGNASQSLNGAAALQITTPSRARETRPDGGWRVFTTRVAVR